MPRIIPKNLKSDLLRKGWDLLTQAQKSIAEARHCWSKYLAEEEGHGQTGLAQLLGLRRSSLEDIFRKGRKYEREARRKARKEQDRLAKTAS